MEKIITRIGSISAELDVFNLKDELVKNDAGDWGDEPKEDAIGIIRSTNFTNEGKLDLKNVAYRSLKPNKRLEKKLFENEILIERSGGSETQPVGRVGLVTNEIGRSDFAFANFIQRIALNETVEPNYVYYCLQQMYEMGITRAMQFQTTGIRNLDWKLYTKSVLPKPPKPEQTAIATILSKVDEAIEATQNSIKAAEKLKKALMQNLLTGKLKPDGPDSYRGRTDDEFYVDEKFGKVPKGWQTGTLKDIADVIAGQSPVGETYNDKGKGMPMLNGPTEFTDYFPIPVQYTTKPTKVCEVGDILFTVRGSSTGRMNFADQEYCIGRGIAAIRANKDSNINFLYYTLVTIAHKILAEAKGAGSTFPNVNRGELNKKKIIYPKDKNIQENIGIQIKHFEDLSIKRQTKIRTLQRLKKSLMQNLLTGKVRLSQAFIEQFESGMSGNPTNQANQRILNDE